MSEAGLISGYPDEIVFHFDVEQHSIPLQQFVDTARSTKMVIDDFNEQLFESKINYEIRVRPSETGGLVEVLGLMIFGGGAVLGFLATDIGKAYIKGLTGKIPADWAEQIGRETRVEIDKRTIKKEEYSAHSSPKDTEIAHRSRQVEVAILVEMLVGFLKEDIERLEKIGIRPAKFRKAFLGRNTIYKACIDNRELKGLSFDRANYFPIKRSDFPRQIVQIPEPFASEIEQQIDWSVESIEIIVNSPNWKRDGRKWQASTGKFQDIAFSIEDEKFWHHVAIKDIEPAIRDNIRVQWAYPVGLSKPSNVRVLRVLNYNGKSISQPLSESELKRILDQVYLVEAGVPDLFSIVDQTRELDDDGKDT